jgi:magnesium transporter
MSSELIAATAQRFAESRPAEAALVLEAIAEREAADGLAQLPSALAAEVLQRMSADAGARVLAALPDDVARAIAVACDPMRLSRLLALAPDDRRSALLAGLPAALAHELEQLAVYPAGTAGNLMDVRVATFRAEASVAQVLDRIGQLQNRRILDVVVTDEAGRLAGLVSLQALLLAPRAASVGSLAPLDPPRVQAVASRDEVVQVANRHALTTLPVVDLDDRVVGVLRYDALVRAAEHAATDDLQQMVGAGREERALSPPLLAVRNRLPWLLINLLTAFAAASVVGLFDETIARFTALAVLMPIVAGQSGNTGAQALAVTSRGLALREIRTTHAARVLRKEISAALINGVASGGLTAAGVYVWSGSLGLALVIGSSMLLSMSLAAAAGALVPLALTALGRDPATASSIILTTVTDITGFFSFLGLAAWTAQTIGL